MKSRNPKLSVIIVNYNSRDFILTCIQSVIDNIQVSHQIIIVDNHSTDDSVELIKSEFPQIRIIENKKNIGFAAANNQAFHAVDGDYILLLNPDARMETTISETLSYMDKNPVVGALGCKLVYPNGNLQYSIGLEHHPARLILSWFGLGRILPWDLLRRVQTHNKWYAFTHEVDWVSGAFLLTRKKTWRTAGGLNEKYFMYMEDVDFCRKVRDNGEKVVFYSHMVAVHDEGMGRKWLGRKTLNRVCSSYLIYVKQYYGNSGKWVVQTGLSLVMLMRAVTYKLFYLFHFSGNSERFDEMSSAFLNAAKNLILGYNNETVR